MVQACRYAISGVLPDYLGNEEGAVLHEQADSFKLAGLGVSFAVLVMVIVVATGEQEEAPEHGSFRAFVKRCTLVGQNGSAMAFAWCILVVCRWEAARIAALGDSNGIICRVAIALVVSFAGFFIVAGLDALADLSITGPAVDNALVSLIQGLSILVGFSWEQAFDGGVECIAEMTDNPVGIGLVLGIGVALVVLEPWRRYILKKVIRYKEENKIRNSMQEGNQDSRAKELQERFKDYADADVVFESMRRGLY